MSDNPTACPFLRSDFWRNLLGTHPDLAELEQQILGDGAIYVPAVVGDRTNELIDGYGRDGIQAKHPHLTLPVVRKSFASRDEAEAFVFSRCKSLRQLPPSKRACLWLRSHASELEAFREQARQNQHHDVGVSAHAPEAPIDLRQRLASIAGVGLHVAGAALALNDRIQEENLLREERATVESLLQDFEAGALGYRTVNIELQKLTDARARLQMRIDIIDNAKSNTVSADDNSLENGIVCCDATNGVKRLADDSVTLFLTSPFYPLPDYPYFGHEFYDGDYKRYLDRQQATFAECFRKQRVGGRCILQVDNPTAPAGNRIVLRRPRCLASSDVTHISNWRPNM